MVSASLEASVSVAGIECVWWKRNTSDSEMRGRWAFFLDLSLARMLSEPVTAGGLIGADEVVV
jgi:hypothetical protein